PLICFLFPYTTLFRSQNIRVGEINESQSFHSCGDQCNQVESKKHSRCNTQDSGNNLNCCRSHTGQFHLLQDSACVSNCTDGCIPDRKSTRLNSSHVST